MIGIQCKIIETVAFMIGGSLVAAAFMGFSMLKAYEEFLKGVEQKSRVRIWSAFFIISFLFIFFMTTIVGLRL
jgi:hypothetical protein